MLLPVTWAGRRIAKENAQAPCHVLCSKLLCFTAHDIDNRQIASLYTKWAPLFYQILHYRERYRQRWGGICTVLISELDTYISCSWPSLLPFRNEEKSRVVFFKS